VRDDDMADEKISEESPDFLIYIIVGLIIIAIVFVIWFFYTMKGTILLLS